MHQDHADSIEALVRRPLHLQLVERLHQLIVEGELAPGAKVPERELCERFNVSRTPMREALKVLASDGLITLTPNRGATVSDITAADLEEVFPVMGALEALAGELACKRITQKELSRIRSLHGAMVRHYEDRHLTAYFRANQEIHEAILAAARNETLSQHYRTLATRIRRARFVANMSDDRWREAVEEHEQILAALEKRNGRQLAAILKRHLQSKYDTVKLWLDQQARAKKADTGKPKRKERAA